MSNLIIGDVTPTTARIWVRGEKKSGHAKPDLPPPLAGSFVL